MLVRDCLAAIEGLPFAPAEAIAGGAGIVVLAPHPDDETLGCGGLIAAVNALGLPVEIVVLTDGAASHRRSRLYPPARLAALRREEVTAAVTTLGVPADRLSFCDLPDGAAPRAGPDYQRAIDTIENVVSRSGAASLFVTWVHDPHCDHETAARAAVAVARRMPGLRLWHYPIWGLHLPPDREIDADVPAGWRLDIAPWQAVKRAALACHVSQMTDLIDDDPDGFHFDEPQLAPFLAPYERFIEVRT